ncbi:hypothetical protein AB0O34_15945 [Sphaerisporangium sp. NPDC088356]|uniref:hypothetical protein n=1 Tax=Sphaerisporangium sp. NPDC088356 TaxID=3154871 RepID=UPI003437DD77
MDELPAARDVDRAGVRVDVDEVDRAVRDVLADAGVDARDVEARGVAARDVDALEARGVALPVVAVDARARDGRSVALDSCSDFWAEAQARAASMVPAPMAAATGHSISPMAASRPSPP